MERNREEEDKAELLYYITVVIVIVIALVVLGGAYFGARYYVSSGSALATPSYHARNMAALKTVQQHDIVACFNDGSTRTFTARSAVLVNQNYGDRLIASKLDKNMVGSATIYMYSVFDDCEVHVFRPSKTRAATDMLANIILYGYLSPPTN